MEYHQVVKIQINVLFLQDGSGSDMANRNEAGGIQFPRSQVSDCLKFPC